MPSRHEIVVADPRVWARTRILIVQESLNISAAADDVENEYVIICDAVDNDVLTHREAAQTRPQIVVTMPANLRMHRQHPETLIDGIDNAMGSVHAAGLAGDVQPDVVQFGFSSG